MTYIGRIPFRPFMVRAILDDLKIETRREAWRPVTQGTGKGVAVKPSRWTKLKPGDLLWVTETFMRVIDPDKPYGAVVFQATDEPGRFMSGSPGKWTPGMFMPRWASRITLEVVSLKIGRLQLISPEDAQAEGVECRDGVWGNWNTDGTMRCGGSDDPVEGFRCLWLNVNGAGSWEANPEVVTIRFKKHLQNVDALSPSREVRE